MKESVYINSSDADVTFKSNTSPDEDRKILNALNRIFTRFPLTQDWYEWFTYRSPSGRCIWFFGEDKKDVISTYGYLPIEVLMCGKLWEGVLAVNMGLIPSYWAKGTYQQFSRFSFEEIFCKFNKKLIMAVPNNIGYMAHVRLGWIELGQLKFVNLSKDKIVQIVDHNPTEQVQEVDFNDLPLRLNEFIKETAQRYELFVMKDMDWLKWRYSRPDYKDSYRFGVLELNEDIAGYIIMKVYRDVEQNTKKLHIMDINYKGGRPSLEKLIAFAGRMLSAEGADTLDTGVCLTSTLYDDFLKIGFEETDTERHLMIYTRDEQLKSLVQEIKDIHFTLGDNDIY